jgi:hypothetical protein
MQQVKKPRNRENNLLNVTKTVNWSHDSNSGPCSKPSLSCTCSEITFTIFVRFRNHGVGMLEERAARMHIKHNGVTRWAVSDQIMTTGDVPRVAEQRWQGGVDCDGNLRDIMVVALVQNHP